MLAITVARNEASSKHIPAPNKVAFIVGSMEWSSVLAMLGIISIEYNRKLVIASIIDPIIVNGTIFTFLTSKSNIKKSPTSYFIYGGFFLM